MTSRWAYIQVTAEQTVGPYIKTLLQGDVAANNAFGALHRAGGQVYAVGGAPRDALQGKIPNDIDLMVGGIPQAEVEHILQQLPGNVTFAGKNFGVFHYHVGGDTVEIALPRTDEYSGERRGQGNITVDHDLPVADDLLRRDFTANAIATNLHTGELIDPHGGASDIKRGILRTTHPDSFREDPSRLVRALTMHGRFNLTPDEQTRHEMEANGHLLRGESPDLLNTTFTKTLKSDNPASAIRLAHDTGLLQHLLPEVHENWDFDQNNPHHHYPLGEHLLQVLDNTSRLTTDPDVRLAALLHDVGKPTSAWVDPQTGENHYYLGPEGQGANHEDLGAQMAEDRLRKGFNLQGARISRIKHLVQNHMFAPFVTGKGARRFIAKVGDEHADDLLNLREADQTGKGQTPEEVAARTSADQMRGLVNEARVKGSPTGISALNISGSDLIAMGLPQGPQIGQVLQYLTNEVVDNPQLNDRNTLLQLAESYVSAQPKIN
jgi:tRNA nucleotidyltransferase (CCA-adding enzyme)